MTFCSEGRLCYQRRTLYLSVWAITESRMILRTQTLGHAGSRHRSASSTDWLHSFGSTSVIEQSGKSNTACLQIVPPSHAYVTLHPHNRHFVLWGLPDEHGVVSWRTFLINFLAFSPLFDTETLLSFQRRFSAFRVAAILSSFTYIM